MPTAFKLIQVETLASDTASVAFTSIPQTHTDLMILSSVRINRSGIAVNMEFRLFNNYSGDWRQVSLFGDTGASYSLNNDPTGVNYFYSNANGSTASSYSNQSYYIPDYTRTDRHRSVNIDSVSSNDGVDATRNFTGGVWYGNADALTRIQISNTQGSNLGAGSSFYLYGISNA